MEEGDCLIHLYAKGKSRRGASFNVSSKDIIEADCASLLDLAGSELRPGSPFSFQCAGSPGDSGYSSGSSSGSSSDGNREIYMPAVLDASRQDAFAFHLTTRNLVAFICEKPLVGASLGVAMVDLLERLLVVRPERSDNIDDLLAYADYMGYLDIAHSPDHALATLQLAERFHLKDLWIDAFVHCVGMNDKLYMSHEFEVRRYSSMSFLSRSNISQHINRVTKALITRASLEMDLHLGRVTRALGNFLEDDLSTSHLGIPTEARAHLDRFRSFLHTFYVAKYGYWPPPEGLTFSKDLLRSMHSDFWALYEHLVDRDSSESIVGTSTGGICVLQNVDAFNTRHNYSALPHPLPLLPRPTACEQKVPSQRGLRSFKLGNKAAKMDKLISGRRAALLLATNTASQDATESLLVQAYTDFEQEWTCAPREKVSSADARKVRWILVYATLQMLVSVTQAPSEVRDSYSPTYPMCCLVSDVPPWTSEKRIEKRPATAPSPATSLSDSSAQATQHSTELLATPESIQRPSSAISIHPDCETGDYFAHKFVHERSISESVLYPSPLRHSGTPSSPSAHRRSTSIRSIPKGMLSSLRRSPTFKTSPGNPPSRPSSLPMEMTDTSTALSAEDYEPTIPESMIHPAFRFPSMADESTSSPLTLFGSREARTPTLEQRMLEGPFELDASDCRPVDGSDTTPPHLTDRTTPPTGLTINTSVRFADMIRTPSESSLPSSQITPASSSPGLSSGRSVSSCSSNPSTPDRRSKCESGIFYSASSSPISMPVSPMSSPPFGFDLGSAIKRKGAEESVHEVVQNVTVADIFGAVDRLSSAVQ